MYTLDICHLYPDLLNLYGDRGNLITLTKRAVWRGIEVNVHNVTVGDAFDSDKFDLILLGGGQDYEQEIVHSDFIEQKGSEVRNAINGKKVFLCVCGGYQMMGKYYRTWDGKEIEFLGALDLWTIGGKSRLIGNAAIVFEGCGAVNSLDSTSDSYTIVGFENHSGRTYLGEGLKPLGRVVKGFGNNGEDGYEGAVYNSVYCSYLHGSLLPKNPRFTDHLLLTALQGKYPEIKELAPLDDTLEKAAHDAAYIRLKEA